MQDASSQHSFNIVLHIPANAIRQDKEIEDVQIGKEEIKLCLFADDMTVYVNILRNLPRKLTELISEF